MTFAPSRLQSSFKVNKPRSSADWRAKAVETPNKAAMDTKSFRPPVLGLTLLGSPSEVPEGGALVLDNWFCDVEDVRVRGGSTFRNDSMTGSVKAIGVYEVSGNRKAFAISGSATDAIYDVTLQATTIATGVTGLANTVWNFSQFTTGGGTFLIATGQGNTRRIFDGTSWAVNSMTGAYSADQISHSWQHANRLFFVEGGTTNAWYLAVDSIAGAATKFALGGIFPRGGSLIAGATWTSDSGNSGLQSLCCFISSEGDVAVYDGPDPTSWTLRGVYELAKPCGINCFMKMGGDLAVMTEDGVVAMSQAISLDKAALANESVSKNIAPLWRDRAQKTDKTLWQITRRDAAGMAVVSVPSVGSTRACQFVVNIKTGAWVRWVGYAATCFATIGDDLVYGTADGRILTADAGGQDDETPYTATWIGRYAMDSGRIMTARLAKATVRTKTAGSPRVSALFNYSRSPPLAPNAQTLGIASQWGPGGAVWGSAVWGAVEKIFENWQTVSGSGAAMAPCVQYTFGQSESVDARLLRVDMIYEAGAVVA